VFLFPARLKNEKSSDKFDFRPTDLSINWQAFGKLSPAKLVWSGYLFLNYKK
jgi:hypothetical protein